MLKVVRYYGRTSPPHVFNLSIILISFLTQINMSARRSEMSKYLDTWLVFVYGFGSDLIGYLRSLTKRNRGTIVKF